MLTTEVSIQANNASLSETTIMAGDPLSVSGTLKNTGSNTSAPVTVSLYASQSASNPQSGILLGSQTGIVLAGKSEETVLFNVNSTRDLPAGNWYLGFVINCSNDTSATNNTTVFSSRLTVNEYVPHDVACLRSFLEQTDSNGVKNGKKINSSYDANDTSTWTGVTWTEIGGEQRVIALEWDGKSLVGSLDVSGCTALTMLYCYSNQLEELDVSGCTALTYLYCYSNQLKELEVLENTALVRLDCARNQLKELEVSKNTALLRLDCDHNQLKELDVSKNTALTRLDCDYNQLTKLDVSGCTALTDLYCYSNQLTLLDVSECTDMEILNCWNPDLRYVVVNSSTSNLSIQLNKSSTTWTFRNANGNTLATGTDTYAYLSSNASALPITAVNANGTQSIVLTNIPPVLLATPTLSVTANGSNAIKVTVGSVTNASSYMVEYSTSSNFSSVMNKSVLAGTTNITGLNPNTTYYFRVKAVGSGSYADSNNSTTLSATTTNASLPSPVLNTPTLNNKTVTVTWSSVDNASGYMVQYKRDSATRWSSKTVTDTTFAFTGTPGKTFLIRVCAVGEGNYGDSEYSETSITLPTSFDLSFANGATIPASIEYGKTLTLAPSIVNQGSQASGAYTVEFYAATSAAKLFTNEAISLGSVSNDSLAANGTATVSLTVNTAEKLATGKAYYFGWKIVSAEDSNQANNTGVSDSACTVTQIKLTAPTLNLAASGSNAVTITVGSVANASGYTVQYSTSSSFSNAVSKSVSAGETTISGLNANTTYYFHVRATGTGNYSSSNYCTTKSIKTDAIQLAAPTLSVSANGSNAVTVTVGSVENASGYTLEYSTSEDFANASTKSVSAGTTSVSGLNANTTYYFRVMATGSGSYSNSEYSAAKSAKTSMVKLATPTLNVSANGSDAVTVTVGSVTNASGYTLQYSTSSSFSNATSKSVTAGTTSISGLNANTTYYFRVMATGSGSYSNSSYSTTKSAKTDTIQLAVPTLNVVATGADSIEVTVGEVANASGYTLEYSTRSDFVDAVRQNVSAGTTTISGLNANTTYFFRVMATGSGAYSDSAYMTKSTKTDKPSGPDIAIDGKKITISWEDDNPAADAVRYRVAGTAQWKTQKLRAGVTMYAFNAQVGTNYEIEVLLDQQEVNILQGTAVVLDQAKLAANKNDIHDDTFQVSITNYTAKNLAANAQQAILTVNGVQTVLNIENQQAGGALASGGNVTFNNGLFTFTEMASNTQYKVQVSFSDGVSVSTASQALSVKTLKTCYLAPEILSATAISDTSILVEWETAYGKKSNIPAQKYTVQYSTDGVKWSNASTGATGNSFTIQRLKGGMVYQVRVLATKDNTFEASAASEALVAETLALPKIALEKTSLKDDTFQLNVTNYQSTNLVKAAKVNVTSDKLGTAVIELQNGTGSAIFTNGTTVAFANGALTFAEVPSNTQQKLQVSFTLADCTTTLSQAVTVKTTAAPYNKPVLTNAFAVSSTSITVEWETVYGKKSTTAAQAYTVQYSTDGVRWTNATTKAIGTSFTITKLKANTKYLVAVLATKDQLFLASESSDSLLVTTME